jgi:ABC-type dipeptide/oligopeptide/nickel transport system permease component
VQAVVDAGQVIVSLANRVLGRTAAEDVSDPATGAILVESVFSWPGVAEAVVRSATQVDFPMLAALTLLSAVVVLLGSLVADVVYAVLDPRVATDG